MLSYITEKVTEGHTGEGTGPGTHREERTGQDLSLVSDFKGHAAVYGEPDFTSPGSLITRL